MPHSLGRCAQAKGLFTCIPRLKEKTEDKTALAANAMYFRGISCIQVLDAAAALQVGGFTAALVVNSINSRGLDYALREASVAAVAKGGANPTLWAFSFGRFIYSVFAVAYAWYGLSGLDWGALPPLLALGWALNAAWVLASTKTSWNLALGVIVAYLASVLLVLPQMTNGEGPAALLGVVTGMLAVWLSAATLLNVQIALPSTARIVGQTAPLLVAAAAVATILRSQPDEATWPRVQNAACLCTAVWVLPGGTGWLWQPAAARRLLGDAVDKGAVDEGAVDEGALEEAKTD